MTTVAVSGAPNGGKTTLFNRLTGAHQTVGNWPGQTVAKHAGTFEAGGETLEAVDLPGAYGLVAISEEEAIAATFLAEDHPDVVVTVVDATNLTGSLHLAAQIAEAGFRQVIALNMIDVAERRGIEIDDAVLAERLGAEVVRTVARRGVGIREVGEAVVRALDRPAHRLAIDYGPVLERHLGGLIEVIVGRPSVASMQEPRWSALQLLGGDRGLRPRIGGVPGGAEVLAAADAAGAAVSEEAGSAAAMLLAERRFAWIGDLVATATTAPSERISWSDRVDRVLTNRWLGVPVFLALMWVVLRFTADVSAPFLDWIDTTISGPVAGWFVALLGLVGLDGTWVESLVVDGVLAGVGGVLVFVPVLVTLYLALAVLEDTGYMARAAAVMDRAMRAIGIPGKAFLPMMVGFGCTVPAIYATRTLDSSRDRLITGLMTPFMSCGARLPVYVLLAAIFFADAKGTIVFGLYLLGILVAVLIGLLLSRTALREDDPTPLVMVMPAFRLPNARTVWTLVWQRTMGFVTGAGTVILVASVAVWSLLAIPVDGEGSFADTDPEQSVFGAVSRAIAPALEPAGFGEWEQAGALITGFVAKEVVISTMAQLYAVDGAEEGGGEAATVVGDLVGIGEGFWIAGVDTLAAIPGVVGLDFFDLDDEGDSALQGAVRASFEASSGGSGALAALAFMVFVLLYTPCMAAVAAFRHEFGTRWMWVSVIGSTAIAWLGAVAVFQIGSLVGLG